MNRKILRNLFYYKNYYHDFFESLKPEVKEKFKWTLMLISELDYIPLQYFKHIKGSTGLYEIRVEVGSDIYRVFSFFDKGQLIVLINGFQKKSQKTPRREIKLAEKLKNNYFNEKAT
jgi:phage-related protein